MLKKIFSIIIVVVISLNLLLLYTYANESNSDSQTMVNNQLEEDSSVEKSDTIIDENSDKVEIDNSDIVLLDDEASGDKVRITTDLSDSKDDSKNISNVLDLTDDDLIDNDFYSNDTVSIVVDKDSEIVSNSDIGTFGITNNHILTDEWYDEETTGLLKGNVTSITFQNTGAEPTSYDSTYNLDENGLKVFVVNSNEVIVYVPDGDALYCDEHAYSMFSFYTYGQLSRYSSLLSINNFEVLDTSNVTNMGEMFYHCDKLTSLDLSSFDTSKVTNMNNMFTNCTNLKSLNLTGFNFKNVTKDNRNEMFKNCNVLEKLNLSNSELPSNCSEFFASSLNDINFSGCDTSNVTDMSNMFNRCNGLKSLDLGCFDTSNVKDMSYMFYRCNNLKSLDLSSFDTSKVINMNGMFNYCSSLKTLNLSGFDFSKIGNSLITQGFMGWNWFLDCYSLEELNLSNTKLSYNCQYFLGVTSKDHALNLKKINFSNCDTSNVTNMKHMFENCSQLTSLDLSSFNTINVKWMEDMFRNCSSLTNLNISSFDTSNVTEMSFMFYDCKSLISLDLSSFDTSKVSYMDYMFENCCSLTSIDISKFNTSNVISMLAMFYNCSSLTSLDLSSFDTSNVGDLDELVDKCSKLTYLDVSSFDTSMAGYIKWDLNLDKLIHIKISDGVSDHINRMSLKGNWRSVSDSQSIYVFDSITEKTTIPKGSGEYKRINSDTYHTITFVPEGGSGDMPSQNAYEDEDTILNYVTFKREGYYFTRWRADNNVYYKNEANIGKVTEDLLLHAEWEALPTPKPRGQRSSGGSGGGGGGGGGSLGLSNANQTPQTTTVQTVKAISAQLDQSQVTWSLDQATGKYKLDIAANGQSVKATNGFYAINTVVVQKINNVDVAVPVANTYYFDQTGNMVTGWVKTADNNTYFFDTAKTVDEGKMAIGWKQILNDWYYFNSNGAMLTSSITPDGHQIGIDGKMIK